MQVLRRLNVACYSYCVVVVLVFFATLFADLNSLLQHKTSGWTALHLSVMHQRQDPTKDSKITHLLIQYNVKACSIRDNKGRTPIELYETKENNSLVAERMRLKCGFTKGREGGKDSRPVVDQERRDL